MRSSNPFQITASCLSVVLSPLALEAEVGGQVEAVAEEVQGELVGVAVAVASLAERQADVLAACGAGAGAEDGDTAVLKELRRRGRTRGLLARRWVTSQLSEAQEVVRAPCPEPSVSPSIT